jgi:histidinol phosphatase-like PHP family hydrolase
MGATPFGSDNHIHSPFSGHSQPDLTVPAILERARAAGMRSVVLVEHVPPVAAEVYPLVLAGEAVPEPRAALDAAHFALPPAGLAGGVRCLRGAEIDADPVACDGTLLMEETDGLDLVLAATHYLPGGRGFWAHRAPTDAETREAVLDEWFAWVTRLAANPRVDVLAHPGALMAVNGCIEDFSAPAVLERYEGLLRACAEHDTAIELNELLSWKFNETQAGSYVAVLALARDLGVRLSPGSDAHSLDRVARFPWMESVADHLGLREEQIFRPPAPDAAGD